MGQYTVGLDFGTESVRAVLVDVSDGREAGTAVRTYPHGIIDAAHPGEFAGLDSGWALQDPSDYLLALPLVVADVLETGAVAPNAVLGLGLDFTACTLMPTTFGGTPLCMLPAWRRNPHAWVKLWKHHKAQPQASRITDLAAKSGQPWLERYGGRVSSEWFFPKVLQILEEAPEVIAACGRLIEAGDWMVWQLCGRERRATGLAAHKAIWTGGSGFPDRSFLDVLHPDLAWVVDARMSADYYPMGTAAGTLTSAAAGWVGLPEGIPVAVANADAHVALPACGVTRPGTMVMVMGTSICHLALSSHPVSFDGMFGCVEDGILAGWYGVEAGQCSGGDTLAWFVDHAVPPEYHQMATAAGVTLHALLECEAGKLRPGESGLLALDWLNGNRSVLADSDLQGMVLGLTLATRAPDIYRALVESLAFGTRRIVQAFEASGMTIGSIVATGGLPRKNVLLMQVFSDVLGREIQLAGPEQTSALGSAIHAAVAAGPARGGYATVADAVERMVRPAEHVVVPKPEHVVILDDLYRQYIRVHDFFGLGADSVMRQLRRVQAKTVLE